MLASHTIDFDVELSDKERETLKYMLDGKCEIERIAKLSVRVSIPLQEKTAQPEAPAP